MKTRFQLLTRLYILIATTDPVTHGVSDEVLNPQHKHTLHTPPSYHLLHSPKPHPQHNWLKPIIIIKLQKPLVDCVPSSSVM